MTQPRLQKQRAESFIYSSTATFPLLVSNAYVRAQKTKKESVHIPEDPTRADVHLQGVRCDVHISA